MQGNGTGGGAFMEEFFEQVGRFSPVHRVTTHVMCRTWCLTQTRAQHRLRCVGAHSRAYKRAFVAFFCCCYDYSEVCWS
jgi:hypothetical protein